MIYFNSDPFLKYRPFPETTDDLFLQHWHELAVATIFYFSITWLAPILNNRIFGSYYRTLENKKLKSDFDVHITSFTQAIVAILLCIPMFAHPLFRENPIFGTYDFAGLACALTCGYFIWDLVYCCIYHFDLYGYQYLFHATGSLIVFTTTFRGYCQPLIPAFLIFELSTPFVNLFWFFTRGPKDLINEKAFMINGAFLIITFFLTRCVWGVYASCKAFKMCLTVKDQLPAIFIPLVFGLNVGFNCLNFFWFSKMAKLAKRAITSGVKKNE
ncbi:TDA4 [Brettanomyces bruxellensis]|uniref:DEBR0S2_17392g1_1 n=1 Tax=Dekkera bruxellensis TaxID=5007 RepID=A0A7D9CX74_DEKBR|nr:uncharacterized protein BRETT_004202 [Brettanomyces bruxellensis]QOU18981.1 hypothetical protein BRETT_004202 [Brettanomyces bruxellensis]VUG17835.1 TDA4 [Brettanomyces bruxellensis]